MGEGDRWEGVVDGREKLNDWYLAGAIFAPILPQQRATIFVSAYLLVFLQQNLATGIEFPTQVFGIQDC